ncbi:DNA-binding SARP family transcriptional activator [Nocardia kruczakiae]|uniref:DNA-binding SARP family transcriptional activator n=1 Tax=Nocardia kruczakiae TaxID=261477 RepID=A0ABU1XMK7_9NOCA|nr:winged helix-turn-helix domain-containing protein [Nocardia kruczakiae]MDR7171744.1 DNA-binding SARP family transcriptional activator [Nocardia kruczakiae]
MLVAVAGVGPGSGVTTTTVALARTWPGPEQAVIVEADPAGGQLAALTGADQYRGLASMARAASAGAPARALEFTGHAQLLPGGVTFLASPPGPDSGPRAAWITALLTGEDSGHLRDWNPSGVTVFADCGAPEPGSVTASILTHADARLLVVHADRDDPVHARHRILALTAHGRRRAVLLIDPDPGSDYARTLGIPVMARLPVDPASAAALLRRPRPWARRNHLLPAARVIAAAIDAQLRPPPPTPRTTSTPHTRPARRHHLFARPAARPTIYRIDLPDRPPPGAGPAPESEASAASRRSLPEAPTKTGIDRTGTGRADPDHRNGHGTDNARTAVPQRPAASPAPPGTTPPDAAPEPRSPSAGPAATGHDPGLSATVGTRVPEAVAAVPGAAALVLSVMVFGPLRVLWRPGGQDDLVEITRALRPRERELLTLLAVHPAGATRETVIEALWPEHNSRRPTNTLNTVVSRLRTALATATGDTGSDFIDNHNARYRLGPGLWDVDYLAFDTAVTALRTATDPVERERACRAILSAADGILGEEITADWIAPIREHARRDRLKALGKLAAMLVDTDPDQTLALLETALTLDPTNEPIYQDILRLHARLGEHTVINPTLTLLKRRLESIGDTPTQRTLDIAKKLRENHAADPDTEQ